MSEGLSAAMTNRSLRVVKTELEFLVEAAVISPQQYETIISQLPANGASSRAPSAAPSAQLSNLNISSPEPEKKTTNVGYYADNVHNPPPPAYPMPPAAPIGPPALCHATAMYQYNAQDAGDLALLPNDKIVVAEYMNNEWWKGRNERTGHEGIFPASYVRREEKALVPAASPGPVASNYGNAPMDVSNGVHDQNNGNHEPNKLEQGGKKFGKKLGNAAVFGAGATIGSKIVNGIF
ncbi:SH3 domain-containing protein [Massarina eburnea CBS 473.64]|uniref:SH3 domain-containing protein n=1 Tax=Massarina eburnea CBS 473.64 TaxID=1395130 RepID=A0A6A6S8Q3_9PLEO|nr:SH3 domain-containing protein [Massarina eburnea CBS 473.64]